MINSSRDRIQQRATLDNRPDAFMTKVNYYEYDSQGLLHSHLQTSKIKHYPHNNAARFEKPNMMVYTNEHIPWYVSAEHGNSQNGVNQVNLWSHVVVHQPKEPNNPETTIKTSAMTLYPRKSYARTNRNVTITRPGSTVKAKGMTANFKKGIITLLSRSRGIYVPPEQHKTTKH